MWTVIAVLVTAFVCYWVGRLHGAVRLMRDAEKLFMRGHRLGLERGLEKASASRTRQFVTDIREKIAKATEGESQ
jgi:membrane protein DedA with SNARE-associated domain